MKNALYAGILSLLGGCASHTTFVEHPVTIGRAKALYREQSGGDCYLKMLEEDNVEVRIYDQGCDSIADSAAEVSRQERFYSFKDRKDLVPETQQYLDFLLQTAVHGQPEKEKQTKIIFRYTDEILF